MMYHIILKSYDMTKFYILPEYNEEIKELLIWLNQYYYLYTVIKGETVKVDNGRVDDLSEEIKEIEEELKYGYYCRNDEDEAKIKLSRLKELLGLN